MKNFATLINVFVLVFYGSLSDWTFNKISMFVAIEVIINTWSMRFMEEK